MGRSLAPQTISDTVWFYENPRSLTFVVECRNPDYHGTTQFRVSSSRLLKSLERIGARPAREKYLLRIIEVWKKRARTRKGAGR